MTVFFDLDLNRRRLLGLGAAAGLGLTLPSAVRAQQPMRPHEPFTFLFITDTHIEPELDAAQGTAMAYARARAIPADFVIQGGDYVYDALGVPRERAVQLFNLYEAVEQQIGLKVYHVLGNHDCVGVYKKSGVSKSDPLYGKRMFNDLFGPSYYSFDHKGVHFVVLDSIGFTPERRYRAQISDRQLAWLTTDLAQQPPGTPVIAAIHIPLLHAKQARLSPEDLAASEHFINGEAAMALLEQHNTLAVLQGHVHLNSTGVRNGIPYLTRGAVCGNWWHGPNQGTPEGFTVVSVADNKVSVQYQTYGFHSVAPDPNWQGHG